MKSGKNISKRCPLLNLRSHDTIHKFLSNRTNWCDFFFFFLKLKLVKGTPKFKNKNESILSLAMISFDLNMLLTPFYSHPTFDAKEIKRKLNATSLFSISKKILSAHKRQDYIQIHVRAHILVIWKFSNLSPKIPYARYVNICHDFSSTTFPISYFFLIIEGS